MIMLQLADENPIGWKENIEFCESYNSSLIHYENHEKFEFLSSKAQFRKNFKVMSHESCDST